MLIISALFALVFHSDSQQAQWLVGESPEISWSKNNAAVTWRCYFHLVSSSLLLLINIISWFLSVFIRASMEPSDHFKSDKDNIVSVNNIHTTTQTWAALITATVPLTSHHMVSDSHADTPAGSESGSTEELGGHLQVSAPHRQLLAHQTGSLIMCTFFDPPQQMLQTLESSGRFNREHLQQPESALLLHWQQWRECPARLKEHWRIL